MLRTFSTIKIGVPLTVKAATASHTGELHALVACVFGFVHCGAWSFD